MGTLSTRTLCSISNCDEKANTYSCRGCSKDFCFDHLTEHRQSLKQQLDLIQDDYNQFRQNLIDMKNYARTHPLIKQIDRWEHESFMKIVQKANQCQQELDNYTKKSIPKIEMKLNEINEQLNLNEKQRKDFNEIHLVQWKQNLEELKLQLNQPQNLCIQHEPNSFISKISIQLSSPQNQTWKQNGTTVAGGDGYRDELGPLYHPYGLLIDDDQNMVIADTRNHRIVEWKMSSNHSQTIAGGNRQGNGNDRFDRPVNMIFDQQTNSLIICDSNNRRVMRWPRRNGQTGEVLISGIGCYDLKMDNYGYLYVCDQEKDEIRRWKIRETTGALVAGGNGQGNRLDQLDNPSCIFIDEDHAVYVSDYANHRVMKWVKGAKEGIVVAGGQGQGNGLNQLSSPFGIIVDQLGTIYIADSGNDRVMRWLKGAKKGTIVVGGNGQGQRPNQLNRPVTLFFDRANNLHVVDCWNNRVQRFDVN